MPTNDSIIFFTAAVLWCHPRGRFGYSGIQVQTEAARCRSQYGFLEPQQLSSTATYKPVGST